MLFKEFILMILITKIFLLNINKAIQIIIYGQKKRNMHQHYQLAVLQLEEKSFHFLKALILE